MCPPEEDGDFGLTDPDEKRRGLQSGPWRTCVHVNIVPPRWKQNIGRDKDAAADHTIWRSKHDKFEKVAHSCKNRDRAQTHSEEPNDPPTTRHLRTKPTEDAVESQHDHPA